MKRLGKMTFLVLLAAQVFVGCGSNTHKAYIEDTSLYWTGNEKSEYRVLLNGEEIYRGNETNLDGLELIDTEKPTTPKNIDLEYQDNGIILSWNPTKDRGTTNKIVIEEYSNEELINTSKLNINVASGVEKYIISTKDKEYTTTTNEITIPYDNVNGKSSIKIKSVDISGNESDLKTIKYENYIISNYGNEPVISDTSQDYEYYLMVNGEKKDISFLDELLSRSDGDKSAPQTVNIINISEERDGYNISWEDIEDIGEKYNYKILGRGKKRNNIASSEEREIDYTSGVKGYYVKVSNNQHETLTSNDKLITENKIKVAYGNKYLHIATVDNSGNISGTISHRIDNSINTTESNKNNYVDPDLFNNILYILRREEDISDETYSDYSLEILNFPKEQIEKFKKMNLKIFITKDNIREKIKNEYGLDTGIEVSGAFISNHNVLYVMGEYKDGVITHELGHALDSYESGFKESSTKEFKNIYKEEKDKLYPIDKNSSNYFKSNTQEYFAQAVVMYIYQKDILKEVAPKTYEYVDKVFKNGLN